MPDPLVVIVFFMLGLAIFGFGLWIGANKERQVWRRWLKQQLRKQVDR